MFDLSELTDPAPKVRASFHWMCASCRKVALSRNTCAACCGQEFIPFMDRRPLLLGKEVRLRILDLIDAAADLVPQLPTIDEQAEITGEYMPFLSKLLDDAELAEKRQAETGSGFRRTSLSIDELTQLFREMKLPPTE